MSPNWIVGLGAFAVPITVPLGENYLLATGAASSGAYLFLSALVITFALLPWCVMMGATFPLMMAFVRQFGSASSSFSFLYLANVIGAMVGTIASALVLVELFLGFTRTWMIAAVVNFLIAAVSFLIAWQHPFVTEAPVAPKTEAPFRLPVASARWLEIVVMFTTGFCSLAMEVVWTRAFTFVLQTTIYAFAMILATYPPWPPG